MKSVTINIRPEQAQYLMRLQDAAKRAEATFTTASEAVLVGAVPTLVGARLGKLSADGTVEIEVPEGEE